MEAEGGVVVVHLRCTTCGAEGFAAVADAPAPCPDCGGQRRTVERLADRRTGVERRGPTRLQRMWDCDPRSWFDRRQA